jgi:hypothetical protein
VVFAVEPAVRRSKDRLVKLVCNAGGMMHTAWFRWASSGGIEGYRWDQ